MTGIFGILESSATQWYQDVAPTQEFFFFFHRPIYSLWLKGGRELGKERNERGRKFGSFLPESAKDARYTLPNNHALRIEPFFFFPFSFSNFPSSFYVDWFYLIV